MNIVESLKAIDRKCMEEDRPIVDVTSLYEAMQPRLTAEDKQELKNILNGTDDPNVVSAFLQTKAQEQANEDLDMETSSGLTEAKRNYISEDFYFECGDCYYEAWYLDHVGDEPEEYAIMRTYFGAEDDEPEFVFSVSSDATVKEVEDIIKRDFCNESLSEKLVQPSQDVLNGVEKIFDKYEFNISGRGKTLFDNIHYQIIDKNKKVINTEEEWNAFIEDVIKPMGSELSSFGDSNNAPITYNFGTDGNGFVTAGVDVLEQQVDESLKEDIYEKGLSTEREPVIEFPNGEYFYVNVEDGVMFAGTATNNGIFHEFEIDYDDSISLDANLENLYDKIIEERPELAQEFDECLDESFWEPTADLMNYVDIQDKYVNWAEWNDATPQQREEMVKPAVKEYMEKYGDSTIWQAFLDDLEENNYHTEYKLFLKELNKN